MKMKNVGSLFCAAAFFATASVAMAGAYGEPDQAEEMPMSAPAPAPAPMAAPMSDDFTPHFYGVAGGVYAEELFDGGAKQRHNSYGWGFNVRAGYRFTPMVAAELLFEDIIEFDADGVSTANNGRVSTDRRAWTLMPNAKVFLMDTFCAPYVSLGGGLISTDNGRGVDQFGTQNPNGSIRQVGDGYGFATRFGAGADFYATENIFLETEIAYVLPLTSGVANYDYLSFNLGIGYAFN